MAGQVLGWIWIWHRTHTQNKRALLMRLGAREPIAVQAREPLVDFVDVMSASAKCRRFIVKEVGGPIAELARIYIGIAENDGAALAAVHDTCILTRGR